MKNGVLLALVMLLSEQASAVRFIDFKPDSESNLNQLFTELHLGSTSQVTSETDL